MLAGQAPVTRQEGRGLCSERAQSASLGGRTRTQGPGSPRAAPVPPLCHGGSCGAQGPEHLYLCFFSSPFLGLAGPVSVEAPLCLMELLHESVVSAGCGSLSGTDTRMTARPPILPDFHP